VERSRRIDLSTTCALEPEIDPMSTLEEHDDQEHDGRRYSDDKK